MKKSLLLMGLATILAFASCKESKKVPQQVQTALQALYPGISDVDWNQEKDGTWEAEFKNNGINTSVTYHADGSLSEVEQEITSKDFPQAAENYLQQHFPGKKVKEFTKLTDANSVVTYEAEVKGKDYIFDAQGNIIDPQAKKTESPETTQQLSEKTGKVELSQLPSSVKGFVSKNYPGYKMEGASHDPMYNGDDAIEVIITKQGSNTYSLIFTPEGKFVQLEEDVDIKTAPSKVTQTLKTKYSDFKISSQIEKLTLANKSIQYLVDVSKGKISKEVIFDANGNVVHGN